MFEQDPRDGLVEGRRGEAAQVGPVALTGRQEARRVDGLLQGEGVALPEDGVRSERDDDSIDLVLKLKSPFPSPPLA